MIPLDLVGTRNEHGESLFPIFRDDDELPANADLATGISRALAHSERWWCLCSPRSAQSPLVEPAQKRRGASARPS